MSWRRALAPVATLVAFGFLLAWVLPNWQQVRTASWQINPAWLLLSALVTWAGWLLEVGIWQRLLRSVGGLVYPREAQRIWFAANLTRYVPGNVWSYLSMVYLAGQVGVSREQSLTSVLLHQLYSTGVGILIAGAFLLNQAWPNLQPVTLPLVGGGLLLLLLWPQWPIRILNHVLAVLKQPSLPTNQSRRLMASALAGYALTWLLSGLGFALFASGMTPLNLADMLSLTFTYIAAYLVGFLSLLTPSGLGVREGVLALFLTNGFGLPPAQSTLLALAARLWTTVLEVLIALWAIGIPLRRSGGVKVES